MKSHMNVKYATINFEQQVHEPFTDDYILMKIHMFVIYVVRVSKKQNY